MGIIGKDYPITCNKYPDSTAYCNNCIYCTFKESNDFDTGYETKYLEQLKTAHQYGLGESK